MRNSARWGVGRWGRVVGGVAVLAATWVGCAAPTGPARTMQPGDFKMLAGTWDGAEVIQQVFPNASYAGGSATRAAPAIQGVIQESGAFFTVLRGVPGAQRPGIMKIGDGGVVTYETAHSKGTMTFHESQDGKSWVWKWDGKTAEGQVVRNELTKPK
jgi:hypothetical protein